DGRRRRTLHARDVRGNSRPAVTRRSGLPMGSRLRHERRRLPFDRRDIRGSVSTRAALACRRWRRAPVGSQQPLESRLPLIRTNWQRPGVAADLRTVRVAGPDVLLSLVAGTEASLRIFAAGADIQRDDRLALEFTAPRSAFGRGSEDAVTSVRQMQTAGTAPGLVLAARRSASSIRDRGLMLLSYEAF